MPDRLPRLSLSATVGTVGSAVSVRGRGPPSPTRRGVATTLQQAAQQLQPMGDYGHPFPPGARSRHGAGGPGRQ